VFIEKEDAESATEGEKVTLMKWGNITISKKEKTGDLWTLYGKLDLDDKDFKKTKKFTWIAADPESTIDIVVAEYDHLITKR